MAKAATVKVKSVHRYNVSAERIFDALLTVEKAKKFMFKTITGKMIKAELDPREGGEFVFIERRPTGDAAHYGKFVTIKKPTQVAFKFGMAKDTPEADLVVIDVKTLDRGGVEVTLTHEIKAEFEHLKDRVQDGWDGILDGLGEALRA